MALAPLSPVKHPPHVPTRQTNSLRGIALMAAGLFLFAAVDTMAKFLTESFHPVQVVWFRQLGLVIGIVILLVLRGPALLRSANRKLQIARGVVAAGSATLFVAAVAYVPLADAVAVSFVAPFFVTLLGAMILRERVGLRRWCAVIIGFLATLIVIRPGLGVVHPAMALVLIAALFFAVRQVISRMLSGGDTTDTTVAYTALVSGFILTLPLPFIWKTPVWGFEIGILIAMALVAGAAEILVIKALETAEAVVVAPVQYSMLLWGTFYGWLIFGQLPDFWTWTGALIIVATGLYTLNRERIAAASKR